MEAAIGQLTRLTSLHLELIRLEPSPGTPLQLQLLDCGRAASSSDSRGSSSGRRSGVCGGTTARSSVGLQELSLEHMNLLSDDELVAAAAALPDLRVLDIHGRSGRDHAPLRGSGLAAFSACQRLRNILLRRCGDLEGQQLVMQLPHISSLASIQIENCWRVDSGIAGELQAAFRHKHGRSPRVELLPVDDEYDVGEFATESEGERYSDESATDSEGERYSDSESESADEFE